MINELARFNANPLLSVTSVLKTIPNDSPQLTMQKETRAMRQYIDPDPSKPTARRRRENKKPETISKGISRIKYAKKNELREYALSACSYTGFSASESTANTAQSYPVKGVPFQWILTNIL